MSMVFQMTMRKHNFSAPIKQYGFQVRDLLGVDFTTHESEVNQRRSPDAVNLIAGYQGSVDKRFGTEIVHDFGAKIWAVYNTSFSFGTYDVDVLIVHAGTKVWYLDTFNNVWTKVLLWKSPYTELTIQERETNFIQAPNNQYYRLIQNNWISSNKDIIQLLFQMSLGTPATFKITYQEIFSEGDVYDRVYIPTTSIGRTPAGVGTVFEDENYLTSKRKNAFLSDGSAVAYILDYPYEIASVIKVEQMQTDGTFSTALHGTTDATITYTVDLVNHKITFSAVPHATYKTGVDNIIVTYATSSELYTGLYMNYYKTFTQFGLNGRNDYLFLTNGFSYFINTERWMKFDGVTMYLAKNNYSTLGNNHKLGYSKFGQYLVLHGEALNNEPTIYLKSASLDDQGNVVFANTPSLSNVGVLSSRSFANLRDDPMWLSEGGINAIVANAVTNVQSVQDRGFYISERLLKEPNLDKAYAFIFENKYFICVNNNVYVADPRSKYSEKLAYSESYQYDWYYWEGLDIQSHAIYHEELYLGTTDGRLMKYKNADSDYPYCDEIIATPTLWASGSAYVKGNIVHDGLGNYYACLSSHDSTYIPLEVSKYWNKIILENDPDQWSALTVLYTVGTIVLYNNAFYICTIEHTSDTSNYPTGIGVTMWSAYTGSFTFQVPVIAYWTTPIMNMGDITNRKTLKNLWVRLGKYAHMSARIYYSTQGIVSEKYDGIFDFSDIDFSRFTFSTDTDPSVLVTNRAERKFMSIQFKVESRDANPFSLLEIVGKYTFNNQFKG